MNIFERLNQASEGKDISFSTDLTKVNKLVKQEALRLYLEGVSVSQIARTVKYSRVTIWTWIKEGGWEWKKNQLVQTTTQNDLIQIKELKERQVRIAKMIQAEMISNIRDKKEKVSVSDGLRALEHEAKLVIPENFNPQLNVEQSITTNDIVLIAQKAKERRDAKVKRIATDK